MPASPILINFVLGKKLDTAINVIGPRLLRLVLVFKSLVAIEEEEDDDEEEDVVVEKGAVATDNDADDNDDAGNKEDDNKEDDDEEDEDAGIPTLVVSNAGC